MTRVTGRVRKPRNAEVIRPIYQEWGRGNWRTRFEVYDPRMEWGWSDEFPGLAGVFNDRQDPNPRLLNWLSGWEEWRVEADDYLEIDDHVVVLTSYQGRGKRSGAEVRQPGAHVFELRHGRVVRLEIFADRRKAIRSARAAASAGRVGPRPCSDTVGSGTRGHNGGDAHRSRPLAADLRRA